MATCVGPPDVIAQGSTTVMLGGMPAARMGDMTAHGGVIIMGCPTVLIGGPGSISEEAPAESGVSEPVPEDQWVEIPSPMSAVGWKVFRRTKKTDDQLSEEEKRKAGIIDWANHMSSISQFLGPVGPLATGPVLSVGLTLLGAQDDPRYEYKIQTINVTGKEQQA